MKRCLLILVTGYWILVTGAQGQVPPLLNYQGRLADGTNLVNGNVALSLRLYNTSLGGSMQYEDSNAVTAVDGLYSTFLGDNTTSGSLAAALTNTQVWIEVAVNGTTLAPRERIGSVPYALNVNAAGISGMIPDARLSTNIVRLDATNHAYTSPVDFSNPSNSFDGTFDGTFQGDGRSLDNISFESLVMTTSRTVLGWGNNSIGQVTIPAAATNVIALAAGIDFSLALRQDGTVIGWGTNTSGQVSIPAGATCITAIAAGGYHGLALKADGTVTGWGNNSYLQISVPGSATSVTHIAAGWRHSLAVRANGTVIGWGDNSSTQVTIPTAATNVIAVAAGLLHSMALRADGTVLAWGDNLNGQTDVPTSATGVVAIAAGFRFSLALRADGTIVGWGENGQMQLDIPPTAVNVVSLSAGGYHSLAVRRDGAVVAWGGFNDFGERTVPSSATSAVAVAAGGGSHSLALRAEKGSAAAGLWKKSGPHLYYDAGRVGIGTPAPEAALHVVQSNTWPRAGIALLSTNSDPNVRLHNTSSSGRDYLIITAGDGSGYPGALRFYDNTVQQDRMVISSNGYIGIGTGTPTNRLQVVGTVQATAYITGSDRGSKENIAPVAPGEILAKVAALPITTWTFREEPGVVHLGPMAQDFRAVFGLGNTDSGIFTVDADGVALAAIQALNSEVRNQKSEVSRILKENAELKNELAALKARLEAVEQGGEP